MAIVTPFVVMGHDQKSPVHMELHHSGFTHGRVAPNHNTTQNVIRIANPDGTITKRTITETRNHEYIERYEEPKPMPVRRVERITPNMLTYNDRYHGFGNYQNSGEYYGNRYSRNGYNYSRPAYPTNAQNYSIMKARQSKIANVTPGQEYIKSADGTPLYRRIVTPVTNYDDYRYSAQKGSNRPDLQEAVRYLRTNRQMYDRFGHPRYEYLHDNDFDAGTYRDNYFHGENHTHLRGDSPYNYESHQHVDQYRITPSHHQ